MREAQSYLDRAKAINAKVEVERQRMIAGLNQVVIVIVMLSVVGLWALSQADQQLKTKALENQENISWRR
ncbi:hypothetical protein ASC97_07260 [Rhizobium sp. Root1203]|uniref:hypothetical protein n=1 Tax=Rhizobium sp. Root1203 TaxID=1736427 RepID=UPI000709EC45|nr:hypothetical protein [Rhizobium sp. Root1203]KQV28138.1 hypothetical protein ASC97_07260 [Rhizobium sp. Root1203]